MNKTMKNLAITPTSIVKTAEFTIPEPHSAAEQHLYRWIIDSLTAKVPKVLPMVFANKSTLELARNLLRYRTGSPGTLTVYMYDVYRFCNWLNIEPDQMINSCKDQDGDPNLKAVSKYNRLLDDYIGELQAQGLTPGTVHSFTKGIKALFRANGLRLQLPYSIPNRVTYKPRAPTPEELQKILAIADLRNRVIVSCMALGGFREGTLTKLTVGHVRRDLEAGIVPLHVHVEANITKGKYHDYDTFLGAEAANYIRLYLQMRRQGTDKIPPEIIADNSPLISARHSRRPAFVTPYAIYLAVHELYKKAGLIQSKALGRRHSICPHSIRKFFKTQLASLQVDRDYIEYMMGHTISTYHDIEMKGIEYLRGIYAASGLCVQQKTKVGKIDALKEIIRAWGLNPEEILTREAQANATVLGQGHIEDNQLKQLSLALKQQMIKEIREDKSQ
ncbi:MAG: site-specific integrase [Candidatus Bathyarchaeota archaeon]|nr:site-specific integrase [Candidatus Bathyarchaeota archaeon]